MGWFPSSAWSVFFFSFYAFSVGFLGPVGYHFAGFSPELNCGASGTDHRSIPWLPKLTKWISTRWTHWFLFVRFWTCPKTKIFSLLPPGSVTPATWNLKSFKTQAERFGRNSSLNTSKNPIAARPTVTPKRNQWPTISWKMLQIPLRTPTDVFQPLRLDRSLSFFFLFTHFQSVFWVL